MNPTSELSKRLKQFVNDSISFEDAAEQLCEEFDGEEITVYLLELLGKREESVSLARHTKALFEKLKTQETDIAKASEELACKWDSESLGLYVLELYDSLNWYVDQDDTNHKAIVVLGRDNARCKAS